MHRVKANGAEIPAIGLGTWTLAGDRGVDLITHALSIGYRHIDTAASYGNEREVGDAIRASGLPRDDLFVTTKVWWTDLAPPDFRRSAEESLKRLGLARVDLLLIHWPNPRIALEDTIVALNEAQRDGLTRHIGVSNFPTALMSDALAMSEAPLVANQVEHHPFIDQSRVLAACRAAGMAMVSYCPLYRGRALGEEPAIAAAAQHHGKTPAQVVLRWQVQQDGVVAIPRTTRKERLAENIGIFDFALDAGEMEAISALQARNQRICDYDFSPHWDAA